MRLIEVKDVFENDELVITKAAYEEDGFKVLNTDIGMKNPSGDIVRIITIDSKRIG